MRFSYEELYSMYGQYDAFVTLTFHKNSESFVKFGQSLLGEFKFTQTEREELEEKLSYYYKHNNIERTDRKILFIPSAIEKLNTEQKISLDKDGILCSDICRISKIDTLQVNSFIEPSIKNVAEQIIINLNGTKDIYQTMFNCYKHKLKNGEQLIELEKEWFYSLKLYFEPESITNEEKLILIDSEIKNINIQYKFLQIKSEYKELTEEESRELENIFKTLLNYRKKILEAEVKRSGIEFNKVSPIIQERLLLMTFNFEESIIYTTKVVKIWLDLERYLHIMLRHNFELQGGDFIKKTPFQYNFYDIINLIKNILDFIYQEINEEFEDNIKNNRNFRRSGNRSVYYNGNYYRIEIEPSGRLITFHPYNYNNKEH